MMILDKDLESIKEEDLQALISNIPEDKTIEYKKVLNIRTDSEKKEFLADVSSFANAAGGHLIFGMKAEQGVASDLHGLDIQNTDKEILRLENIIRDGVEPRIPGVMIRDIPLRNSNVAIIIRIPRSWTLPHRVIFKGSSRFYSRNSKGKYPLDMTELRSLFLFTEKRTEQIRNFRTERLSKIVSEETPILLRKTPKIVLHIVPLDAFNPAAGIDISSIEDDPAPLYATGWNHRFNFDGYLIYGMRFYSEVANTYLQIFRNGSIEAVEASILRTYQEKDIIPSVLLEKELLKGVERFLLFQKDLGVEPPLFIMLSLLGVHGFEMSVGHELIRFPSERYPIDRDALLIPEIMIESFNCDPAEVMRPIFDAVWNATGWPRSMNYDEEGKWVGH